MKINSFFTKHRKLTHNVRFLPVDIENHMGMDIFCLHVRVADFVHVGLTIAIAKF